MLTVVDRLTAFNRQVTLNLSAFCLVLSMLVVSADAIGRKLGITVPGAVSVTELFIAGMVFGGIVFAQTNNMHLYVGLLDSVLPPIGRLLTDLLGLLIGFVSTAFIAWFGFLTAIDSWEVGEISESTIDVPVWPSRFILAIGSLLLCLQFVLDAIRQMVKYDGR